MSEEFTQLRKRSDLAIAEYGSEGQQNVSGWQAGHQDIGQNRLDLLVTALAEWNQVDGTVVACHSERHDVVRFQALRGPALGAERSPSDGLEPRLTPLRAAPGGAIRLT
jgi:hypothetical protein